MYGLASHSVWSAWIEMIDGEQGKIYVESHSVWSAWIEISKNIITGAPKIMSHSVWSAWIEIKVRAEFENDPRSHSVWSAWIEILNKFRSLTADEVALRLECVDRNTAVR